MLQANERKAIQAALRFANIQSAPTYNQALRCFGDVLAPDALPRPDPPVPAGHKSVSFDEPPDASYKDEQDRLRDWLSRIKSDRTKVAAEVSRAIEETVDAVATFEDGRFEVHYILRTVGAACAFGVALILDKQRGLTTRLLRCDHCQRFNLELDPKGRPRRFCNQEHKRLADNKNSAAKMREWRKENAAARNPKKARKV